MAKLTIDDLKKIKEKSNKETSLRHGKANIKVTVHMGTCGIAAGAREVMNALMEEMAEADRQDIRVVTSGCMGMCSSEPNVTVRRLGEDAVLYGDLNGEKMRKIFQGHILNGEIQSDLAVARIK